MDTSNLKVRIIKIEEVTKKKRPVTPKTVAVLNELGMWQEVMQLLEADQLGVGEACVMDVPATYMEKYQIKNMTALVRPVKTLIRARYGSKYRVRVRAGAEGPIISVEHPAPGA